MRLWLRHDAFSHAGALAFFALFSLAPTLIVAVVVIGIVLGEGAAQGEIVAQLQETIGPEGAGAIEQAVLMSRVQATGLIPTLLGGGALLIGATTVFGHVLAYVGWRHEHDQRQFVEIQRELNQQGMEINERNVGKLYRQYLALLGATSEEVRKRLDGMVAKHGVLVFGVDALQPEGPGSLLYVLYEILSGTVVSAIQVEAPCEKELIAWLQSYQMYPVLASIPMAKNGS